MMSASRKILVYRGGRGKKEVRPISKDGLRSLLQAGIQTILRDTDGRAILKGSPFKGRLAAGL